MLFKLLTVAVCTATTMVKCPWIDCFACVAAAAAVLLVQC
jgi:hypothetical protein